MSELLRGIVGFVARLRYFVPALAVTALAAFIDHPAVLLLLLTVQPLYLAGAVSALGYLLETDFTSLTLRRGSVFLVLLVLYAGFVAVVLGTPVVRLAQEATPLNALLVSVGFALSVGVLWRTWPAFGLAFLWDDAYTDDERGSWIVTALRRSLAFAGHLTAERDPYFGRGLPVAIGVLALVGGAMSLAGLCGLLPSELRLSALWLYAFFLSPLVHLLLAQRCERLLLDEDGTAQAEERAALAEPVPLPVPPPAAIVADPATRDAQLLAAAAANQIELALALIDQGASPDARPGPNDRDQRSLLIIAATCPDMRLLRSAIARGGAVNQAIGGLTPLLAATRDSYQGRPDAVMTLVTNGADTRLADPDGNTPLHFAALSCEATVAAMLVDAGADLDVVNRDALTPLGVACAAGNEVLVRFLLEHRAAVDVPRAVPALIAAAGGAADLPGLVKLLVRHRADVDARDRLGRTALHAAALHGHAEMVDALIAAGATIDARDSHGVTALMEAARGGANRVLQRLVFRKPAVNPVDQVGRTALVIACQSRQANDDTVRMLLALGADPSIPTKDGKTALDYAIAAGRWPLVALIEPSYPLPNAIDDARDAPPAGDRMELLAGALRLRRMAVVEELLALDPPLSAAELDALAPLAANDAHALALLVRHGLALDARGSDGRSLLERLAAQRPVPVDAIQHVLDAGAAVGGPVLAALLEPADDATAAARVEALALALVERGADPFGCDARGRSLLHLAAARALPVLLATLLARGLDPNRTDGRGRSPLHELAALREEAALRAARALLVAGADPERTSSDGQTPLGAALAAGRATLTRWLSWNHGFRHPGRALRDADLPAAASAGDRLAVERLLDLGLPVDARDAQGCTALLRASGGGHVDLVGLLLARGADASLAAATGATCLSAAVSARREAVVARLLDHGVAPDQPLPGGSTPLMVAAALGLGGIVDVLIARGAAVGATDDQRNGPLHAACQHAFQSGDPDRCRALLKKLIASGAPVDAPNAAGQTPLLLLLGARVGGIGTTPPRGLGELVDLLLANGAEINAQDQRGVGCLHAAAMHGLADVCQRLLRAGADPDRRDRLGRTAYEVALMLGYADIAAGLKRAQPGVVARTRA